MALVYVQAWAQYNFLKELGLRSEALGDPVHHCVDCGAVFVVIYTLCFVTSATTTTEILERCAWISLVFDVGCLVELASGLFRRGSRALAHIWEALQGITET